MIDCRLVGSEELHDQKRIAVLILEVINSHNVGSANRSDVRAGCDTASNQWQLGATLTFVTRSLTGILFPTRTMSAKLSELRSSTAPTGGTYAHERFVRVGVPLPLFSSCSFSLFRKSLSRICPRRPRKSYRRYRVDLLRPNLSGHLPQLLGYRTRSAAASVRLRPRLALNRAHA